MSCPPLSLSAVEETLQLLTNLAQQPREPREAMRAVAELSRRHGTEIELVWEREPYDGRLHYDALLRHGDNMLSIAVCPDTATPWPIRGLQRWSDSDLVRVDGRVVTVQSAIDMLDIVWNEDRLLTRLVDAAILLREKEERGIADPDAEALQQAIDDFRRERGLWTREATEDWLIEHGLDLARLESALADRLVRNQIRDVVVPDVDPVGAQHTAILDQVTAATVDLTDLEAAERIAAATRAGEPLLCAAQRIAREGVAVEVNLAARLQRGALEEEVAREIFCAPVGSILGPIAIPGRQRLIEILSVRPADPGDPETRFALREHAFTRWMAEQRRCAKIEWSWGRSEIEDKILSPQMS